MIALLRFCARYSSQDNSVGMTVAGAPALALNADDRQVATISAHGSLAADKWLQKHPRFHLHFTPTSSSWLNLVERWFGEITRKRIRRGVFKSVPELIATIDKYILVNNKHPKPFVWTKKVEDILEKIAIVKPLLRHYTRSPRSAGIRDGRGPGIDPCRPIRRG